MYSSVPCHKPKENLVKKAIWLLLLALAPVAGSCATPAQEKAFVDAYRKAIETKDEKALTGMLYTKGADPQALEFYKVMAIRCASTRSLFAQQTIPTCGRKPTIAS